MARTPACAKRRLCPPDNANHCPTDRDRGIGRMTLTRKEAEVEKLLRGGFYTNAIPNNWVVRRERPEGKFGKATGAAKQGFATRAQWQVAASSAGAPAKTRQIYIRLMPATHARRHQVFPARSSALVRTKGGASIVLVSLVRASCPALSFPPGRLNDLNRSVVVWPFRAGLQHPRLDRKLPPLLRLGNGHNLHTVREVDPAHETGQDRTGQGASTNIRLGPLNEQK